MKNIKIGLKVAETNIKIFKITIKYYTFAKIKVKNTILKVDF